MTADEKTPRGAGSARTDQVGKVFVVGQDVRKCLVCEQVFTRRASAEHANVACHPKMCKCQKQRFIQRNIKN
jgi:hypothetical protein